MATVGVEGACETAEEREAVAEWWPLCASPAQETFIPTVPVPALVDMP